MNIYEHYGVKPIINVAGAMTRYGGTIVGQEVLDAMEEAARYSVPLDRLQAAASRVIAARTHAEAGIVTCGASHALTLATAACICGWDVARMNRLPFTDGMPNEVIMPLHHISGYDHALQAAGARLIPAGFFNDTPDPFTVRPTDRWELESYITEHTAAFAVAPLPGSHPPLEQVVDVAHRHGLPVIVDASPGVPPLVNLHRYTDMGADLVTVSGGKGIGGPQASAILCGRKDLVGSALLQMLDLAGERFDDWNPPSDLIPRDRLCGKPLHGIGRSGKVTKEAIIGLLVALEAFTEQGFAALCASRLELVRVIETHLTGITGVGVKLRRSGEEYYPVLEIAVDAAAAGVSAIEVARRLKGGEPALYLEDSAAERGILCLDSLNLQDRATAELVGQRLRTLFSG
ncbi:MAG: aminotransferase class V-fold PLP-dependent enzyme [Dehalococcoidia bacterium]|jgi:L-seryl-tRNA(Ser) seleniumtransferase|nr:aminotransferase class V-fold PLP-dependent enzyme [Dehalococcoidia bacterium]